VVWVGNKGSRLRRQDVKELPLACCGAEGALCPSAPFTPVKLSSCPLPGPAEPAYFEAEVELLRTRGGTAPCEVHLSVQTRGGTTPLGDAVLDLAEHEAALENDVVVQELALAGWPAQPGSQQPRLRVAITLCELHSAKARGSPIASIEPEVPTHANRERLPSRADSASESEASSEGTHGSAALDEDDVANAAGKQPRRRRFRLFPRLGEGAERPITPPEGTEPDGRPLSPPTHSAWLAGWRRSAPSSPRTDACASPPPIAPLPAAAAAPAPPTRTVHHARSASAPAEALAAPHDLDLSFLSADELLFQTQLAAALEASSGRTLPSAVRLQRRSQAPLPPLPPTLGDCPRSVGAGVCVSPLRTLPDGGEWLHIELTPATGEDPVAADVFFAGIDQRSEDAGGAGACACLSVAIAAWLEAHPSTLPTAEGGAQLDRLVREGSERWRALRRDSARGTEFPDGHFDLETALGGEPSLHAPPSCSYVAFLRPSFDAVQAAGEGEGPLAALLRGAPTLREAVAAARREAPATAVLSLLDHHCVVRLCAGGDAVLVETLGERLYEGNTKAFLLRFCDDDALVAFVERIVVAPRLRSLGAELCTGQALQADLQVLRTGAS